MTRRQWDAVVVGSGPNGLAAAVTMAEAGCSVLVLEAAQTPGGGCRTEERTLPGFRHDVCSAVHPLAVVSPFFRGLRLRPPELVLRWPEVAFAHPLDGGRAAAVRGPVAASTAQGLAATTAAAASTAQGLAATTAAAASTAQGLAATTAAAASTVPAARGLAATRANEPAALLDPIATVRETATALGRDGATYRHLIEPLVHDAPTVLQLATGPLRALPDRPLAAARFGLPGLLPVRALTGLLRTDEGRALFAGAAAHAMTPLEAPVTSAFALLLTMTAHVAGWPVVEGGSVGVTRALVNRLMASGGRIETGQTVTDLRQVPPARAVLLDVGPKTLLGMAASVLPARYRRALARYRYGMGVCKVDWALSEPVPWTSPACRAAGTVHVGGTVEQVARSERVVAAGGVSDRPFCLVSQPTVIDPTRAPPGRHTLWAYCHVPAECPVDMRGRMEAQIERFAPGFRDVVLAGVTRTAAEMEAANANLVGGDIGGGAPTLRQTFFRPTVSWHPYKTPLPGVYLCSASTPPGGGVHGMCGLYAARAALHDHFGGPAPFRIPEEQAAMQ